MLVGLVTTGIIGGGIGGLLSSIVISKLGFDVTVFEEHEFIGLPKHCTGLVSEETLNNIVNYSGINLKEVIKAKFDEYMIVRFVSNRFNVALNLKFSKNVLLIDRVKTEQLLAHRAKDLDVNIRLRSLVSSVRVNQKGKYVVKYMSKHNVNNTTFSYLIIAEGAKRMLSSKLGLCKHVRNYYGLQTLIKVSSKHDVKAPLIIVGPVSKYFFGWIVPVHDDELIVGIMDKAPPTEVYTSLTMLIRKYLKRLINTENFEIEEYFGGLIPYDMTCTLGVGNICSIGDASSLVKPLTGGGLYVIAKQIKALSEAFKGHRDNVAILYRDKLSPLIKALRRDLVVKRFIDSLGGYDSLVRFLSVFTNTLKVYNYDNLLGSLLSSFSMLTKEFL